MRSPSPAAESPYETKSALLSFLFPLPPLSLSLSLPYSLSLFHDPHRLRIIKVLFFPFLLLLPSSSLLIEDQMSTRTTRSDPQRWDTTITSAVGVHFGILKYLSSPHCMILTAAKAMTRGGPPLLFPSSSSSSSSSFVQLLSHFANDPNSICNRPYFVRFVSH